MCTILIFSMKISLFFSKVLLIHCGIAAAFSGIVVVGRYICSMHCNVIKKMQLHKLGNQIVSISPKFPHPFVSQSVLRPALPAATKRLLIWFCMVDGGSHYKGNERRQK